MPRYKSKPKRLTKSQQKNWQKTRRAAARSKNKNRPLFKRKRPGKQSVMRGKPRKVGTGHWLTVSTFGRKQPRGSFLKGMKKTQFKMHYNVADAFQITSVVGQQIVSVGGGVLNLWTPRTVYNMASEDAHAGDGLSKLLLVSGQTRLLATNQSNANQFIEIYEIVNRNDVSVLQTQIYNPYLAWNGSSDQENVYTTQPGSTPFESRAFTLTYKVLKVTRYNLALGESIEHITNDNVNRVFDSYKDELLNNQGIGNAPAVNIGGFKGLTKWLMIVQWSAPYNDSTTKTQVSLGAGSVDYVFTRKFTFQQIEISGSIATVITNNLPQAFTVSEDVMDVGDGVPAVLTNA